MTNTELLKDKIDQNGLKMQFIAQQLELSVQGLRNKIYNRSEFTASEITTLAKLLSLEAEEMNAIFFNC